MMMTRDTVGGSRGDIIVVIIMTATRRKRLSRRLATATARARERARAAGARAQKEEWSDEDGRFSLESRVFFLVTRLRRSNGRIVTTAEEQFLELEGKPVLYWSLELFLKLDGISR